MPGKRGGSGVSGERERDKPMTPAERREVARRIRDDRRRKQRERDDKAERAYKRVLETTGDSTRAEKVRAKMRGEKPAVSRLTRKHAKAGTLPSTAAADQEVRSRLKAAGVPLRIREGGLLGQIGQNIVEDTLYAGPGMYLMGREIARDVRDVARGDVNFDRSREIGKQVVKGTYDTVRHPLRRPGSTLLLGLGAVSGGATTVASASARAGAAGRAVAAGAGRKAAVKAALKTPDRLPEIRKVKVGEMEAQATFSRNPARATLQKALDERAVKRAEQGDPRGVNRRAAAWGERNRKIEEAAGNAPQMVVRQEGRKLTLPQQVALRAYLENTPIDDRVGVATAELGKAKTGRDRARLRKELALLEAARPYLTSTKTGRVGLAKDFQTPRRKTGRSGASPVELRQQAARVIRGGERRETQGLDLGLLTPGQAKARKDAPARITRTAPNPALDARAVARGFDDRWKREPDELLGEYARRFGSRVDPDLAKELSSEYAASAASRARLSAAVHETSSRIARSHYERLLAREPSGDKTVLLTSGGSGAGKSLLGDNLAEIVYDSTLSTPESAFARIAKALETGRKVVVQHVYRDPVDALVNGVVPRASVHGRTVPLETHVRSHVGANRTIKEIERRYANDPSVEIQVFVNTPGGGLEQVELSDLPALHYNEVYGSVNKAASSGVASGRTGQARQGDGAAGERGTGSPRTPGPDVFEGLTQEEVARGRAYVGYGNQTAPLSVFRPFASRTGARPKPSPTLKGSLKEFTGGNLRRGDYDHNTSRVAAAGMAAMNRHHQAVRLNERLYRAGVDARPDDLPRTVTGRGVEHVPVRIRQLKPGEMRALQRMQERVDEGVDLGKAERQVYDRAIEQMLPAIDEEALAAEVGQVIPGVRWVPRQVFDRVSAAGQTGSVATHPSVRVAGKAWREFQSGMRGLVLYSTGLGAGYITPNLLANVGLLAMQGGPRMAKAAVQSLNPKFRARVGADAWNQGKALMGEGFATATFGEKVARGPLSGTANYAASKLSKVTDEQTRMVSLYYEASRQGFRSPAEFRKLLTDPKLAERRMDVVIRARDAALDYELMSPAERSLIASWVFVYPFLRASGRYTANFPLDHPMQAAVIDQLAKIAQEQDELGARPDFQKGLVDLGSDRDVPGVGKVPMVANANALSPFPAALQSLKQAGSLIGIGEGERGEGALDLANPAVTSVIEMLTGKDSFTGAPVDRDVSGLAGQVASNIPLVRDWRQATKTDEQRARQVSPRTGRDIALRQVMGSLAPRPYNVRRAEEFEEIERRSQWSPEKRARVDVFKERQQLFEQVKRRNPDKLENGRLPKRIRDAYNREAEIAAARARARDRSAGSSLYYQRFAIVDEARLLEKWGVVEKGFASDIEALAAATTSAGKIDRARDRLRSRYMGVAYQDVTRAARQYLSES